MVETDPQHAGASLGSADSSPIGAYLKRQRVLRGISAEELADLTRIPLRSLERLEAGAFDGETDGFVRGFVRTVAAALGLDTEDTIMRMLHEAPASSWERRGPSRRAKQLFALGMLLLVLGSVGFGARAIWTRFFGVPAQPASREVVLWRDPVRGLAELSGLEVDPRAEIAPGSPAAEGE